jgi:hypothetical protein
MAAFE